MSKALFVPLQLSLGTAVCLSASPILAQVTPDGTVNTQVNQNGNVAEITGGETRGGNLFHSFQDFSVPTNNTAFFDNNNDVSNIFSRVTGGNISNIDGAIRANGSASLFLINPAGILLGENASLDLGGSFYGSTADSILFEGGEFSAVDNLEQPLLTVNAPIGLGFRDNPRNIVNRSFAQNSAEEFVGLEVDQGNTLALIGGDINFEAGEATASGGNIYLGGLAEAGIVNLNEDGSLSFPDNLTKANITLTNGADIDTRGTGGGNIIVDAQNLSLAVGEFGSSLIRAGISPNSTSIEAQAGDIVINVVENITLDDSSIINQVNSGALGNSGKIDITTSNLILTNGGLVSGSTFGQGNAGIVNVNSRENITVDGESQDGFTSGIYTVVGSDAEGSVGEVVDNETNSNSTLSLGSGGAINIFTSNLNLTNGGQVSASIFGQGNAGTVNVNATGDIIAEGESSSGFSSRIISSVASDAIGNAGGVEVTTFNLTLNNGARIDASTFGQGNAGVVNVSALGDISADGESSSGFSSGIASSVNPDAEGDSGGVFITTANLNLTNGGSVSTSNFALGNSGTIIINASDNISIDGNNQEGFGSSIESDVNVEAIGDTGGVDIFTTELSLNNGGTISASTFGRGNAGSISIDADNIFISGFTENNSSGLFANALVDNGSAGNIDVSVANQLIIEDGGIITASNFDNSGTFEPGTGRPGNIIIDADSIELLDNASIDAATQFSMGEGGNISLQTAENITLRGNSLISAQAFVDANGGNIDIDSRFLVAFPVELGNNGNDILASALQGNGGNITIDSQAIFGLEERPATPENGTNDIDVSGLFDFGRITPIFTVDFERPVNILEPEQTIAQTCQANRVATATGGLIIDGKGGVPPEPGLPLSSSEITVNGERNVSSSVPSPIETSQGKIQPARGIKVTESGEIILTAYRTNNAGERLPEIKQNCG